MWIAPNVLTFTGFLFTVANFVLLSIYDYSFHAADGGIYTPVPRWVWILAAFNLFMAHTLGKLSSVLGSESTMSQTYNYCFVVYIKIIIVIKNCGFSFCLVYSLTIPKARLLTVLIRVFGIRLYFYVNYNWSLH